MRLLIPAALVTLVLAGCSSSDPSRAGTRTTTTTDAVRQLGEPFQSSSGEISVLRAQDEYRFFRHVSGGPIAGMFEDVMVVPRAALSEDPNDGISWNEWIDVVRVPGLKVMFLSPNEIVFRDSSPDAK